MQELSLPTGRGGRLQGRLWTGSADPRAVVVIVHGLGDHGERYRQLAEHLSHHDYAVFTFDLPGHGHSPGPRGHVDSYVGLLEDIDAARQTVAQQLPEIRHVLLGHSMGGNLALNYLLRRQSLASEHGDPVGLALCGPMILPPKPPPRPQIFAAWLTGHLLPWIRISKSIDIEKLTQDGRRGQQIRDDELMHNQISIYLATQLLSQGRWALDHARRVSVPTLIMHGEDDSMIDRSACEHAAIRIGRLATLVTWPETRHDLFHEVRREEITRRLIAWLDALWK